MQCIRPLNAQFKPDYSGISFSRQNINREMAGFTLPCRKCLPCRLEQAREKAIRCYHESQMHENNIFLTLTYNQENLRSTKLIYSDFQNFMKRLRHTQNQKIPLMVTGEYGELNKRPHFHALLFNYRPEDEQYKYTTDRGDKVSTSQILSDLWSKGNIEYGDVTIDSANYVARYAAKKLVHGKDQEHDFHPIHKTSSRYGIGRSWIEVYYKHALQNGFVLLPNGQKAKVPRYYIDWAKRYQNELWHYYMHEVLPKIQKNAELQTIKEMEEYEKNEADPASFLGDKEIKSGKLKRSHVKEKILASKFKLLQEKLKL